MCFADGSDVYSKLSEKFTRHDKGCFILAPSGAGKTFYIENNGNRDWIDGDELWMATGAQPDGAWWTESLEVIDTIERRCDIVTEQARAAGFRILGSSNVWLRPDAIVVPDLETHKKYILARQQNGYDGGITSDDLDRLEHSRNWVLRWQKEGVPVFISVEEAVKNITL